MEYLMINDIKNKIKQLEIQIESDQASINENYLILKNYVKKPRILCLSHVLALVAGAFLAKKLFRMKVLTAFLKRSYLFLIPWVRHKIS
jgi:hypothetical protein